MDECTPNPDAVARTSSRPADPASADSISHGFSMIQDMFDHANERIRLLEARVEELEGK
jgi:hypothetical protein